MSVLFVMGGRIASGKMPSLLQAPLKFCATPRCGNRVKAGHCSTCARKRSRQAETRRRPVVALLHTNRWKLYSKQRLARYPWCVGYPPGLHVLRGTLATCTDHIRPAREYSDLFWEPSNHQSLCGDCNSRKNIAEEAGFGYG